MKEIDEIREDVRKLIKNNERWTWFTVAAICAVSFIGWACIYAEIRMIN